MEEREREGGGDGAGSSSSAGASAALLLVMVVVVMQEEGDEEQKGERGIEKERLRGSGEIVRATAKRNETKRFSCSYIYAAVDKPRLRSSNTELPLRSTTEA